MSNAYYNRSSANGYSNGTTAQQFTATITSQPTIKTTQYGEKAFALICLPNGTQESIFDNLDQNGQSPLLHLQVGQQIQIYCNANGNWKVAKNNFPTVGTANQQKVVPVAVKPVIVATESTLNISDDNHPIRKQARLLRDCVDAVLIEFQGIALTDEVIQKYATSLFISLTK